MAKSNSVPAIANFQGKGLRRIDGIIRNISPAGVSIDVKETGRTVRRSTLILRADIVAYTDGIGAGFVVVNDVYSLDPIFGHIIEENEDSVVMQDADGTRVVFPVNTQGVVNFGELKEDDSRLARGSVATAILRRAEAEGVTASPKAKKKKAKK